MAYPKTYSDIKIFGPYGPYEKIASIAVATDTGGTLTVEHLVDGDPDEGTARWNVIKTMSAGDAEQLHTENATFRATPNSGAEYSWVDGRG